MKGIKLTKINDGGPAFPVDFDHHTMMPKNVDEAKRMRSGMSMRDYFAAKAMHGVLSNSNINQANFDVLANIAYKTADAMLKARSEGGEV